MTMNMRFKTSTLLLLCAILLPACSNHETVNLQRDFDQYHYSSYVSQNLKNQPTDLHANVIYQAYSTMYQDKLRHEINQIQTRKKRASTQLGSTILNNGLYTPSLSISHQVATLNGHDQNGLKNNSSLDAVLGIALTNNLDIKSSLQQAQASLAKYDQVSFLDDMLAQYATFNKDIKLSGSAQKHNKSVNSGFPFPGLLALKASIINQAVESARLKLKQTVQNVITQTRTAYYALQFTHYEIANTQQTITLLKTSKTELESNYTSNTTELSRVLNADIEIEKNRNKLRTANEKKQAQQASLNALLNLPPSFKFGKLDPLAPVDPGIGIDINSKQAINKLLQRGKQNRVEISRLKSGSTKMERIIQLSEKRFYPDFDAGFSRFQNQGSNPGFRNRPKIKNSNFFAKNDAYLGETKQRYQALQSRIRALQIKTVDEIQQALSSYQIQKRTHHLYQSNILPKAKASLDIARNRYETGETSYLDVIDAEMMILKYRLLSYKALKEMNVSAAKMARLVGK